MGFVQQAFSPLLQRYFHATKQAAAQLPIRLYTNVAGAFASAVGSPPPGAPSLQVAPHDHSTQAGGVPLPRGVIYSFNGGRQTGWAVGFGEGVELPNDANSLSTWTSIALREYGFKAPVTPGIDSSKTNLSSNPCTLEGWGIAFVQSDPGAAGKLRINNLESATLSDEAALSPGWQEFYFTEIPCVGGIDNRMTPEAWLDDDGEIFVYALSIAETRRRSQPASAGANRYDNLTGIA